MLKKCTNWSKADLSLVQEFIPGQAVTEGLERYRKHANKTINATVVEVQQFRT